MEASSALLNAPINETTPANNQTTSSSSGEPTCAAMVPTGVVVAVQPLGRLMRDGKTFYAYAVKSDAQGITFYALYLDFEDIVHA